MSADNKNKTYDGAVFSPFTATLSGFVNSETSSLISGSAWFHRFRHYSDQCR